MQGFGVNTHKLRLRVGEGLGVSPDDVRHLPPLATQTLNGEELARLANLGNNGPRDAGGRIMTHCVPNEHAAVADQPDLVVSD
jgi:catalase